MIVCVCNNVSDRKIRQAVDSGMTSLSELRAHLDVGTCCGKCHVSAKTVLRECLATDTGTRFRTQPVCFRPIALAA